MSKKKFRIGELAKELKVKKFVIRFWEKEFDLKSDRSQGGQRYYTQTDFRAFNTIKRLLYKEGFTIAGAKVQLTKILESKEQTEPKPKKTVTTQVTAATKVIEKAIPYIPQDFLNKVEILKKKLIALKENL